ncbi:uncharacterized protein A1O9_04149 [Exophiala aquamarina CBS 119918]|uniref:NADH:flavin oxidoreductase/NADH oxidase N-terminal domain-containing protein n=1 Tax=Exophiala aquamarina CBS 119918 TaxID=1182545 RepID=A0A072PUW7_9EURO|nr:uncharacterized protein A1O9_04149 [Exophiala aquamarina CBS 119918]KEF59305.1 hypothetical protein A1O9_04149 [Exophiala aquamarina CBS 119918]
MSALLEPVTFGKDLVLRNRVAMASLTRNRCVDSCKPGPAQVRYYSDRARDGPGIIVSEGTLVDWAGLDWPRAPCMISNEHADAWRVVVDAVHKEGSLMFMQAWHAGRCQHDEMPIMKNAGRSVLAPSSISAKDGKYHDLPGFPGHTDNVTAIEDPRDLIETYRRSISLAKTAGFDGIELLCQGGYLPQQFLNSRANKRTDAYGGPVENRSRFALELVDAASEVFGGPEFICIKISPTDTLNDSVVTFDEMQETYTYLIKELVKRKVGIVTICRRGANISVESADAYSFSFPRPKGYLLPPKYDPVLEFGGLVKFPGSPSLLMANQDYGIEEADQLVREGKIDLLMIGRPFIFNPDVVTRIRKGVPFANNDRGDFVYYGPYRVPDENYNDWPVATA